VAFDSIRSQITRRGGGKFHNRECWAAWRKRTAQTRLAKLLKQQYGMTESEYEALLTIQGGVCGICRRSPEEAGQPRLVVDHDHATGRVRGLLCSMCNQGLGRFQDSPALLASALSYLGRRSDG
jgi:hypothetical protein